MRALVLAAGLAATLAIVATVAACDLDALLGNGDECSADADCSGSDLCDSGECVECENDRDCDDDEECNDGDCDKVGEGEGEGDAGEGEGDEGEGEEGEGEGESTPAEAFCAHLIGDCGATDDGTCVSATQAQIDDAANQGSSLCQQMSDAFVAFMTCQTSAACADIQAQTDCSSQRATFGGLADEGGLPCLDGNAPVTIPAGWLCPGAFFGSADGCDCGCGVDDTDCAGSGCPDFGCSATSCEFCYPDEAAATSGTPADACEGEGEGEGE